MYNHLDETFRGWKKNLNILLFSFLYTTEFSEMEFILFHLRRSTLSFSGYANLIGLLHLFLHDDSGSYKHNVTLLYLTHIWNHLPPFTYSFIRISWCGSFPFLFLLCNCRIFIQNMLHAAACCYDNNPTCADIFFFLMCLRNKIATLLLPVANRILVTRGKMAKYVRQAQKIVFLLEGEEYFQWSQWSFFIVPLVISAETPVCLVQYIKRHLHSPSEAWWWQTGSEIHWKLLPPKLFSPFQKLLSILLWKLKVFLCTNENSQSVYEKRTLLCFLRVNFRARAQWAQST